jgi:soluble lytic murein transglycosylase-like protein
MDLKKVLIGLTIIISGCNSNPNSINSISELKNFNLSFEKSHKNFVLRHSIGLAHSEAERIAGVVKHYSKQNNVDPKLVLALIARESSFRTKAISSAGAVGLGQLMPATARHMGISNSYDLEQNIKGTTKYLDWLRKRTKTKKLDIILASYNMGPSRVEQYTSSGKKIPSSVQSYINDIKRFYSEK